MEWISVYKRVPKDKQHVLCYEEGNDQSTIKVAKYIGSRNRFETEREIIKITHWMPLPELPVL